MTRYTLLNLQKHYLNYKIIMAKIGIFYGSSSGNTQQVAEKIAELLNVGKSDLFDIASTSINKIAEYDSILIGSSTWGIGDVQDDWNPSALGKIDLSGKKIAVFGTGDSSSYPDSFCDAIGILAESAQKAGATLIGNQVDTSDYSYDSSNAEVGGFFCGLPLDEDNEPEKTDDRIDQWIRTLKESL